MLSIEEIRTMSPEELEAAHRELGRKLIKKFVTRAFVTATIVTVVSYALDHKLNSTTPAK